MSVTPRRPLAVQPHPYIGDVVGRPLDRGMIYFGEPDKDPQDYPITVYLDPEQTKPAHQPIRTKGGFINVFGDITEIFADEILYSLKVLDCYGRLVFYKKRMHRDNITEELGGEIVRAQKAESALQISIDAEAIRAKKAESDLNANIIKEVSDRKLEVTRLDEADAVLQAQINSVGGGKLAYKTYAEMIADKSNIAAKSSIDILADTDDKNGTYLYDGANFVKSKYSAIEYKTAVDLIDKNTNLVNQTTLTLDFINNELRGGGGYVTTGNNYIDGIPDNQVVILEPESERHPSGIRKVAINKTTKLFKVFNTIESVTSDYLVLGNIVDRQWRSTAVGKTVTVLAKSGAVEEFDILPFACFGEVVAGSITIDTELKTVTLSSVTVVSEKYRASGITATLPYTGGLDVIVMDINLRVCKAISNGELFSPSYVVLAYTVGNRLYTSSLASFFKQTGEGSRYEVVGSYSASREGTEVAFLGAESKLRLNFQTGKLEVDAGAVVFHNSVYTIVSGGYQEIAFDPANYSYVRYITFDVAEEKFKVYGSFEKPKKLGIDEPLVAYYYDGNIYGVAENALCISIINPSGEVVPPSAGSIAPTAFDPLVQRALLPNKLFFIEGKALPLYKDSVFSAPQNGLDDVRTWIDTNNVETIKRYISVTQQTVLNPDDIGSKAQFVYAHKSVADKRYHKTLTVAKAPATKLAKTMNMLCFGDSLTQVSTPWTIRNRLNALGATVTSVGTFSSSESPNEIPSEGRGYWNYRGFIGKSGKISGIAVTRSSGGKTATAKFENPFLKLATAQDKADHPTWCFRNTQSVKELSYVDDPVKTGDFYIFDFNWYLTQHSVANPDFITIGLSTNDINLDGGSYSREEKLHFMNLGLEIMVKQIHKVLPNVPIGIIPAPAWSATTNGYNTFSETTATWIEQCIKKVAELKAIHTNLEIIPVHLHMNRDMGYPIVSNTNLSADSDIQSGSISDWVHYDQVGRDQYADAVAAWLANVI